MLKYILNTVVPFPPPPLPLTAITCLITSAVVTIHFCNVHARCRRGRLRSERRSDLCLFSPPCSHFYERAVPGHAKHVDFRPSNDKDEDGQVQASGEELSAWWTNN